MKKKQKWSGGGVTLCLMNDFLYPFSIIAVIVKRLTNRWVVFPKVRSILLYPLYLMARNSLNNNIRAKDGGLVFLCLKKSGGV